MSSITTEIINNVGVITLNRPNAYNSFDREMALSLQSALDTYEQSSTVKSIYLTGNGKAFSAGQDIKYLLDPDSVALERIVAEHYNPIVQKIYDMSTIVVCGVNGVAAGAGANIALICDITVAAESASFIQAFSKIGLIPDSGGTYTMPRLVGFQKALALALLGDKVSAHEAERMGMLYKVFPDEKFYASGLAIATKLAQMPTIALSETKRLFNASLNNTFKEQLALEGKSQTHCGSTEDYAEGIKAFVEKRKPQYQGK